MKAGWFRTRANGVWLQTVRGARRLIVFVVGTTVLLFGVVMLVTPGPGWLLIVAGLSVLGIEFVWARRLLRKIKARGNDLRRIFLPSRGA
jgi:tellurite resistance protein TerC